MNQKSCADNQSEVLDQILQIKEIRKDVEYLIEQDRKHEEEKKRWLSPSLVISVVFQAAVLLVAIGGFYATTKDLPEKQAELRRDITELQIQSVVSQESMRNLEFQLNKTYGLLEKIYFEQKK